MIAPLRRVHRLAVTSMLIGLPILFAQSLQLRPAVEVMEGLPQSLQPQSAETDGAWAGADPLVYRSSNAATIGSSLPADSHLIGTLRGTAPVERMSTSAGETYFAYSLAKQEVLAIFDEQGEVQ